MPANAAIDIDGMPCKIDCRILAPTKPALKQVGAIPGICLNLQAAIVLFPRWLVVDLYSRMLRSNTQKMPSGKRPSFTRGAPSGLFGTSSN
jgi:hypothetical protein